ncbi:MAG: hypothetical protein DRP29_03040 [Thermodesulfobacteriota bacterium]|nr:MAG: hypothetical protein DRP29_03040 [Thermodesulfobacteriota bacterium]
MKNIIPEVESQFIEEIDLENFFSFLIPDEKEREIVEIIKKIAQKRGEFLYFAGGAVRDYLLGIKTKDFDLVLQGNLEELLKEFLKYVKGKIIFKSQFLTYKVKIFGEKEILMDFITARKENYPEIAHLPEVIPSHFIDDIKRRDFTINSMIIGLTKPYEGKLIDLLNGRKDLKNKFIKPLHLHSFIEDPTRIFRGIRYKVRLNFNFHENFLIALKKAFEKEALTKLTPSRISNELYLYFIKEPEENLKELLNVTLKLGIFETLGFEISYEKIERIIKIWKEIKNEIPEKEKKKAFLLSLTDISLKGIKYLEFSKEEIQRIEKLNQRFLNFISKKKLETWEKIEFLEKLPVYFLPYLAINFLEYATDIVKFLKHYRKIKPELSGEDLIKLGVSSGPEIGRILKILRRYKIEKKLKSKEEEKNMVINILNKTEN